ncbi:Cloroperoxidase [Epithele typhae]|uniref:Cloroperoxidase n=1 Tax=Epithele typhae TaxID=378194 RepID=UPI002007E025|nr:Cloroperoxidase [Epithele typhae]KAH9927979.1 Cloroperoxidase [Epithele typhae]
MFLITAIRRILLVICSSLSDFLALGRLYVWDFLLLLFNTLTPDLKQGKVIPSGHPGFNGEWPKYIAPAAGSKRSPCPGLNAMANHGIIARDGRNIRFSELPGAINKTFNIATPFATLLSRQAAELLNRDPATATMDLSDVNVHNVIEHDASFCRQDIYDGDQSAPTADIIEDLLASGTGTAGNLVPADLSTVLGRRRVRAKAANPQFGLTLGQKLIGSTNAALILRVFGGIVDDLRAFLLEERLPQGWEPRVRHRMGFSMIEMNFTIARVELGVVEEVNGTLSKTVVQREDVEPTVAASGSS